MPAPVDPPFNWSTDPGTRVSPPAALQATGAVPNVPLGSGVFNALLGRLSDWVVYLSATLLTMFEVEHDIADGTHTDITLDTINFKIGTDRWTDEGLFAGPFEVDYVAGTVMVPPSLTKFTTVAIRKASGSGGELVVRPQDVANAVVAGAGLQNAGATGFFARMGLKGIVPQGAQLTEVRMFVRNADADPVTIIAEVNKAVHATGAVTNITGLTYDSTVDAVGSDVTESQVGLTEAIDYDANFYYVDVEFDPDAGTTAAQMILRGFEFTFKTARILDNGTGF